MISIDRRFTSPRVDVYNTVEWETRTAEIPGSGFKQEGVEFPKSWSQRATNIVASKYFYGLGEERETSLKQLIGRVVRKITLHAANVGYLEATSTDLENFRDELTYILLHQYASFNSPVWFNVGVKGVRQQASACFINGLEDSMESIMELATAEAAIFKRGSGAGVNISKLRAEGENLTGGGTSSGPLSFMKGFDAFAGVIKSGGVTRRAAKMVLMDDDHPDVMDFIDSKGREEKKAHALIAAGYDPKIDGEAYASVFFQNANHSVRLSDAFMAAVEDGDFWTLKGRRDDTPDKQVDAYAMFKHIAQVAWECGDPGVQFTDTINNWHMAAGIEPIYASNPCSEFVFLDNTACNLASINVSKFWDGVNRTFDWDAYAHVVRVLILAMEILCDLAEYPTEAIAERTAETRPLGLGLANLGDLFMRRCVPYDSDQARTFAADLMSDLTATAYQMSAQIASQMGPCSAWRHTSEHALRVLQQHRYAAYDAGLSCSAWDVACAWAREHGLRNLQVSVCAPTGTISFMMDCGSTGIEPLISLTSYKTLVGGGTVEITPECVSIAKEKVKDMNDPVYQTAIGDNPLPWQAHVEMLGALSPFVSGAISKTVNMPNDATVDDVMDAYIMAHRLGVKCLAIYRDGCKASQPVSAKKERDPVSPAKPQATQVVGKRRPLPNDRAAFNHKFRLGGHNGYITVGLYEDGTPGEVFVRMANEGSTISGLIDAWSKSISFLLQHGVSLDFICSKFKNAAYEPAGFTGNADLPSAKSVTDYVVRWLELRFGNVVPSESKAIGFTTSTSAPKPVTNSSVNAIGFTTISGTADPAMYEELCVFCSERMQPNGSCHVCTGCGATTGCG